MSAFNPMTGAFAPGKPRLTAGTSTAIFIGAAHVPAGPRAKFAAVVFKWTLVDGPDKSLEVTREVPVPQNGVTAATAFGVWAAKVGGMSADGTSYDLTPCMGKRFRITVGERPRKDGTPSGWMHVVECVPVN